MAIEDITGGFITQTGQDLASPLIKLWLSFVNILPGIIAAIVMLVIGYLIAYLVGYLIKLALKNAGIDRQAEKTKLFRSVGYTHISAGIGEIVKWYIFIIFLDSAADVLKLGTLSILLNQFVLWAPNLIAAVLVLILGLMLTHYIALKIEEHTEMKGAKLFGNIFKGVLSFIVVLMALRQIGIDVSLLETTFLVLIASLGLGMALAIGIGVGLGAKKEMSELFGKIKKYF